MARGDYTRCGRGASYADDNGETNEKTYQSSLRRGSSGMAVPTDVLKNLQDRYQKNKTCAKK